MDIASSKRPERYVQSLEVVFDDKTNAVDGENINEGFESNTGKLNSPTFPGGPPHHSWPQQVY